MTQDFTSATSSIPTPTNEKVLRLGREISEKVMKGQLDFENVPKKSAHVKWAGRSIALGTFPVAEAKAKAEQAKKLTKIWRSSRGKNGTAAKPSREWVISELERLQIRIVSGRRSAEEIQQEKVKKEQIKNANPASASDEVSAGKKRGIDSGANDPGAPNPVKPQDADDLEPPSKKVCSNLGLGSTFTMPLKDCPSTSEPRQERRRSSFSLIGSFLQDGDYDDIFGPEHLVDDKGHGGMNAIREGEILPNININQDDEVFSSSCDSENDTEESDVSRSSSPTTLDESSSSLSYTESNSDQMADPMARSLSPMPLSKAMQDAPAPRQTPSFPTKSTPALNNMLTTSVAGSLNMLPPLLQPNDNLMKQQQQAGYYDKLKAHHMNLLTELQNTTKLLGLYQDYIVELQNSHGVTA